MFTLLSLLMINLSLKDWKLIFNKEKTDKEDKKIFLIQQVASFVIGLLASIFATELLLVDKSIGAFFLFAVPFIVISQFVHLLIRSDRTYEDFYTKPTFFVLISFCVVYLSLLVIIVFPIGNAEKLHDIVDGKDDNRPVEKVINIDNIVTVPYEAAVNKGKKVAGKIPSPTSFDIGEFSIQNINDELFWVAPIEYASVPKALKVNGTPGYVKVSAENIQANPEVVSDYSMKYIPSAVLGEDLMRHVRHEYPSLILSNQVNFEPDDTGKPYYVVSYGEFVRYRDGLKIEGVIIVDAQNGSMEKFAIKDVPSYVDEVFTDKTAFTYNEYYGKYEQGFWNSFTSQDGVHVPTKSSGNKNVVGIFDKNKKMHWFTDHTTGSEAKSMVGYTLMDSRTGELVYYTNSNGFLNGSSAVQVVNDTFKAQQWYGTTPVIYNIYGAETWVVPVLDSNGMYRELAIVHAESGKLVHDVNKETAFQQYKSLLSTIGNGEIDPTDIQVSEKVEGTVERVQIISANNNVVVKVMLQNQTNVYSISDSVSPYAVFIKEGDTVRFEYNDNQEVTVNVIKFESDFTSQ